MKIQTVQQLYDSLRTIIPNLPHGRMVQELVLRCGPVDEVPTVTIVQCVAGPDGAPFLEDGAVKVETVRFKIIPEDEET